MKDLTRVLRLAQRRGLRYVRGRKHAKILDPNTGKYISLSNTPSCPNAHKAVAKDLKRYLGVDLAR